MRIVTKRLRLKSRGFRYKVALYLSYMHIKFDDEIKRESIRILSVISYIAGADPQNISDSEPPTGGGYLCSDPTSTYYIFSTYDSINIWYNIDDTKAAG